MSETERKLVLGGGCFWCLEAIYSRIDGCESISPGYAAGNIDNPSYRDVCNGGTGHAEVIEIVYDSAKVNFRSLVEVFFATHDATTLNRQGNDVGTQYRSIICYSNNSEKKIIAEVVENEQSKLQAPIVTEVIELPTFYPAEIEHHDYYAQNTNQSYCQMVIKPKLDKLIQWKEKQ